MGDRLVVYLDTGVLSLLAKVALGWQELNETDLRLGQDAFAYFTSLTESRVAIFPDSLIRNTELELRGGNEFERASRRTAARLSRGVEFHPGIDILSEQIKNLFVAYLDGTRYAPAWQEAFAYNPRGPIPRREEDLAGRAYVVSSDEGKESRRELKRLFVEEYQQRARKNLTYEQVKALNARKYLELFAIGPMRRFFRGESLDVADRVALNVTGGAIKVAQERGDPWLARFSDFVRSDVVLSAPMTDIRASIEASIELDESSRKWRGSDHYDLDVLSEVLPYCDAVFCDRNMKGILGRRKVDSRYGTRIYSMRDFKKFREDVDAGPAGPLGAMDPRVAPIAESWQRVTDYLVLVARAVDPDRWDERSPYPGWSYKHVLAHLATGYTVRLAQLRDLVEGGELGIEPDADAANAASIATHRGATPEALVREMVRQRSEVGRLLGLLRPERLEARTMLHRPRGRTPREGPFLEALQHYHEHDLEHAADLAPVLLRPVAPPRV